MALLGQSVCRSGNRHKRMESLLLLWLCGLVLSPGVVRGQSPSREYQLKAVFLYNFAQFTEWPTNAFADAKAPLVIGVLGKNSFGKLLEATVTGEKVNGRNLVVRPYSRVEDINECHLLFISQSEADRIKQILASLKGRSILTVGESENFAVNGGVIRFLTENNKIRLRINTEAAKQAKLTLSSKLLRLAEIIPAERN